MPSTIDLNQSDRTVGTIDGDLPGIRAVELLESIPGQRDELVSTVRNACAMPGFFTIDTRNVLQIDSVIEHADNFFTLDDKDARKQSIRKEPGGFGWRPMFEEPSYQPGTVAHLEAYDIGFEDVAGQRGFDVWPELPGFKPAVLQCWNEMCRLGAVTLSIISEACDLDHDFLPQRCDSLALNTMRLLHYPAFEGVPTDRDVGIAAHTDFEVITLIYQTSPGLELTDSRGNWYDAPAHDGRIVVLLDDMLERWTNGAFTATGHRVRNTPVDRHSIVMFFAANEDVQIAPLPHFVDENRPLRFEAITQSAHIDEEMRRSEENRAALNA